MTLQEMNRASFFTGIRASLFDGKLSQAQVDSINAILNECIARNVHDYRHVAYILATAYHETGAKMTPTPENLNYSEEGLLKVFPKYFSAAGGNGKKKAKDYARKPQAIANYVYGNRMGNGNEASGDGYRYRGRDLCQTTGKDNYRRCGNFAGVDLVQYPERISEPRIAAVNIVQGMKDGWFTAKKLSDYLDSDSTDFVNARRIINGTDKADLVANHARKFYSSMILL